MKPYLITTGSLFTLLTVIHIWRMTVERHLATDPWYIAITLASATLGFWAWRLLRLALRSSQGGAAA